MQPRSPLGAWWEGQYRLRLPVSPIRALTVLPAAESIPTLFAHREFGRPFNVDDGARLAGADHERRLTCPGIRCAIAARCLTSSRAGLSMITRILASSDPPEAQRVMRLIFEPSRLKLYISPCGSIMKAMMGLVRVLVSMDSPAPTVTTTIDPSTPTFQPSVF